MEPVSAGQRRDCPHPRARHQHGTAAAWRADGCRCPACTDAHRAARRHRARAVATGFWQPTTPAAPVREHLRQLRAAGIGIDRISQLSGIPGSTVRAIVYGKNGRLTKQMKPATAQRLLAIRATDVVRAHRATIDAAATQAKLRDLLAAGLRWPDLARELGRTSANLRRTMHRGSVTIKTAHDIARLHRRLLRGQTAPLRRVRAAARPPADSQRRAC